MLEILGREAIVAINQGTELNLPVVDALLLAETDGYTQAEADYQMEKVLEVFRSNHAGEVKGRPTPRRPPGSGRPARPATRSWPGSGPASSWRTSRCP